MVDLKRPLFKLGLVLATPGAVAALEEAGQAPSDFLDRHITGDWGCAGVEDCASNDQDVDGGGRLMSAYKLNGGVKIWIITEADRSATTILLPSEY